MRVLHVVTAWPREPEDIITPWLVALGERQAERGYEVEVLAPSYRGLGDQRHGGIRVHRFRYAPARWERLTHDEATPDRLERHPAYALLLPSYLVAGAVAGHRLGRLRRYDAVHVHWAIPHGVSGWLAARAATRARRRGASRSADRGCALVTTFYSAEVRWAERRFPPAKAFLRWYCRRSRLVAISEAARALVEPYAEGPIEVVPYGVPLPQGSAPDAERGAAAAAEEPEAPTLLFVGRLVRRKGVNRLLEALATLGKRPWRLEVVGFGPEREGLEAHAARLGLGDRVAFLGRVPDDELVAAYRRAAAFALPATLDERADTEGLGVVLLEAMSHGVPVVATRRGGISDIVVDGVTGILVEDEVSDLARGLDRILSDPEAARAMGQAGRRRVREAFGWDTIVDRLEAIYARGSVGKG
jgi:glycosyltransferase involved in cell wall biosynthesis